MKRTTLASILTKNVTTLPVDVTVSYAMEVMSLGNLSSLIIVDIDNRPIGIFTERDSIKVISGKIALDSHLGDVMSQGVYTVHRDDEIHDTYAVMSDKGFRHLVIVNDEGRLEGVATQGDFLRHIGFDDMTYSKNITTVMTKSVVMLNRDATITYAASMMAEHHSDYAVIMEGMIPVGLITERDILQYASAKNEFGDDPIWRVYQSDFPVCSEETSLSEAASLMERHGVHQLIIADEDGNLIGLLTRYDLLQALHGSYFEFLIRQVDTKSAALTELKDVYSKLVQDQDNLIKSEEKFRTLFDMLPDGVVLIDPINQQTIDFNSVAAQQLGYTTDEFLQLKISDYEMIKSKEQIDVHTKAILMNGRDEFETVHRRKNGSLMDVRVTVSTITIQDKNYFLAYFRDITDKKRQIIRFEEQLALLGKIATNIPMQELLETISLFVEKQCEGIKCSILLADKKTQTLQNGAAPSIPSSYTNSIIGVPIAQGNGSCGTACATGLPVVVSDVFTDPLWQQYLSLIKPYSWLRACWSTPFFDQDKNLLGTFALYANTPRNPDANEQELMTYSASLAGMVVERFSRQEAYAQQAVFLNTVINTIPDLIWVKDTKGVYLACNEMFERLYNAKKAEIIGKDDFDFVDSELAQFFQDHDRAAIEAGGSKTNEEFLKFADGSYEGQFDTIKTPMKDVEGNVIGVLGISRDITDRKRYEERLETLANYDPLTGLANRALLSSHLKNSIEKAKRNKKQISVLMFDLDRFKDVNDSFGHAAGDELLQQVAQRFDMRLRDGDIISRLGGDEFAIVLEHLNRSEDAGRIAKEMIDAQNAPYKLISGAVVHIGMSAGIVIFPDHGENASELLQHADAALYKAKGEGRGIYRYYTDELTDSARQRIEYETCLRRAVANNEFEVYYQPQVHIATGKIVGAEALVRWNDPEKGMIFPSLFIPIAEETGLISAIGEWVLNETCRQGKIWLDGGHRLTLAVNLSAHQVRHQNIPAMVEAALKKSGFPADKLELELTESALMQREEETVAMLHMLRAQGIRLAIDDFGTGYSSLSYLKRFPIDVLKIDKSFVDDLPFEADDMAIVTAIIAMGTALGFQILAEGTERIEQIEFLKERGCTMYQGYYKSPPLPAEEFIKLLEK
ncbi:MAG: EAL domain-containing protein [Sulfuricurvum sp.]|nr:EAL domain-containing protein [Sulfuricurvum sp.]